MNQSLNLVQDLEFTEAVEATATIVGGLTIGRLPIDRIDIGGCFPKPRFPVHPPICEFPAPRPKPPIVICYAPVMPPTH